MSFGTNFKKIRKEAKLTQEQVATMLNISAQAISRWETDSAMPDISLLPAIANTFHVTTDSLLGVDVENVDAYIDNLCNNALDFNEQSIIDKVREFREAIHNNPNNTKLKEHYILLLYILRMKKEHSNDQELVREICNLCSDLIKSNTELVSSDYYFTLMVELQSKLNGDISEEIVEKAKELPHIDRCHEIALPQCLKGKERLKANKKLLFDCMSYAVTAMLNLCLDGEELEDVDTIFEDALHFPEAVFGKDTGIWFTDYAAYLPYFQYLHRSNQHEKAVAQYLRIIGLMEQCMTTEKIHLSERLPEDDINVQLFSRTEYAKSVVASAAEKILTFAEKAYSDNHDFANVISRLTSVARGA